MRYAICLCLLLPVLLGCEEEPAVDVRDRAAVEALERIGVRVIVNDEGRAYEVSAGLAEVRDEHLRYLADLSELQVVSLKLTDVTDAGLVHLEKAPKLKAVDLQGSKVTQAGVQRLADRCPDAEIFY